MINKATSAALAIGREPPENCCRETHVPTAVVWHEDGSYLLPELALV